MVPSLLPWPGACGFEWIGPRFRKSGLPNVSYKLLVILTAIYVAALTVWGWVMDNFGSFISMAAQIQGPIIGMTVVDYLIVKKRKISLKSLYNIEGHKAYEFTGGFNLVGLGCMLIAFVTNILFVYNPLTAEIKSPTRFVPISLEKPKGLLVVKNEVLIERQIEQLQEAGIHEIVLVLGYKKEAFFYLEDKYEGLRIIINPEYNTKNNTHTLYLAQSWIKNTYICSSDDYFEVNPFEAYVYQS